MTPTQDPKNPQEDFHCKGNGREMSMKHKRKVIISQLMCSPLDERLHIVIQPSAQILDSTGKGYWGFSIFWENERFSVGSSDSFLKTCGLADEALNTLYAEMKGSK